MEKPLYELITTPKEWAESEIMNWWRVHSDVPNDQKAATRLLQSDRNMELDRAARR